MRAECVQGEGIKKGQKTACVLYVWPLIMPIPCVYVQYRTQSTLNKIPSSWIFSFRFCYKRSPLQRSDAVSIFVNDVIVSFDFQLSCLQTSWGLVGLCPLNSMAAPVALAAVTPRVQPAQPDQTSWKQPSSIWAHDASSPAHTYTTSSAAGLATNLIFLCLRFF